MSKAYVLIVNASGTEEYVISNLNYIQSITHTFGTYDIFQTRITNGKMTIPASDPSKVD